MLTLVVYLKGIAWNQDKGLSWDFAAILAEFSRDLVAQTKS